MDASRGGCVNRRGWRKFKFASQGQQSLQSAHKRTQRAAATKSRRHRIPNYDMACNNQLLYMAMPGSMWHCIEQCSSHTQCQHPTNIRASLVHGVFKRAGMHFGVKPL